MKKSAAIFGTGLIYSMIRQVVFDKYNVVALFDNNDSKWGASIDGVMVRNPADAKGLQCDVFIIAATHSSEIARQLQLFGVPLSKMEIGANYVFRQMFDPDKYYIACGLDVDCNMVCDTASNNIDVFNVNIFDGKKILFDKRSISTLVSLFGKSNHLPDFFRLSEQHHGIQTGVFLDVGANIGTSSIQASEFANVDRCIALEPSSQSYALLMANIFLNRLQDKVFAHKCAAGEIQATNKLRLSPLGSGDDRLRKGGHSVDFEWGSVGGDLMQTEDVSTVVIDEFLDKELGDIRYVWIDVQGYEYYVLKGCDRLLSRDDISVQIEYWPHGLMETHSLELLNQYLAENFSGYVDMNEYAETGGGRYDIGEISSLADKLTRVNKNFCTDLFLIK